MGLLSFILNGDNKRNLKKVQKQAADIELLRDKYSLFSDQDLKNMTTVFKERLANGESSDDIMNDAFAVVREASKRVLKMEHYQVQIMGAIVLYQGRIAEMKTGEGKTLVATLAAYLRALEGKGVHIVTVNDYLARRDANWMGKLYNFLGLTVGVNLSQMTDEEKIAAYAADITYGTNNEFGFDYLRDNLKITKNDKVQRKLYYAIVDEVDSILIDEARTPLIISGRGEKSSDLYVKANKLVKSFNDDDFEIDTKEKSVNILEGGVLKAESFFKVGNLSDIENKDLHHHVQQALKAHYLFKKDNDYIISDGEIVIVDEFTGRLMIGRRYSEGLHQAIEAKEGVVVRSENKTHATITFQNYFRLYEKLSGMTGTAKTEEEEFKSIYGLDVVEVPTNKPLSRSDLNDVIYPTENGKIKAIVEEIKLRHANKQPILVGTVTVEKSEQLADFLKKEKVPHNVLNAKNHALEAEIIAQAGKSGAVTIATNMAGRGTDILLGGNPEFLAKRKVIADGIDQVMLDFATSIIPSTDPKVLEVKAAYEKALEDFKKICDVEKQEVIAAGGLHILGTERHESRRIDNQLRGRAGRQGDLGSSVFYISLEDDLAKRFGGESMQKIYNMFKVDENTPISMNILSNRIEGAQKAIEGRNFSIRKNILEYDNVMNKQREVIYTERDKVLNGESVHDDIVRMLPSEALKAITACVDFNLHYTKWDFDAINKTLEDRVLPRGLNFVTPEKMDKWDNDFFKAQVIEEVKNSYESKFKQYVEGNFDFAQVERIVLLRTVDDKWIDHIDSMDILRRGISLRAYAQQDPVIAYKKEAFDMFEEMIERIQEDAVKLLLKAEFQQMPVIEKKESLEVGGSKEREQAKSDKLVGRNDTCPCGSGKKYKQCCGK